MFLPFKNLIFQIYFIISPCALQLFLCRGRLFLLDNLPYFFFIFFVLLCGFTISSNFIHILFTITCYTEFTLKERNNTF